MSGPDGLARVVAADCPAGWLDKSMTVYSAPPVANRAMSPNIVVSRDHLGPNETFREYCNRQYAAFRTSLPGFEREAESFGRVGERDAFQVQMIWESAAGTLRQRVFFVDASPVIVNYAASAAADDWAAHEAMFMAGLAGLQIDVPAAAGKRCDP